MPDIYAVLRSALIDDQLTAAMDPSREVLALACAGSGKSRTLAYRIARLVAGGASPDSIVAFTFTEKAADSIKRRVGEALQNAGIEPTVLGAMYIGTIHAFCQSVLAQMDARYRQFDVLDGNRLKLYLISRYAQLGLAQLRTTRAAGVPSQRVPYFDLIEETSGAWTTINDEMLTIAGVTTADADLGFVLQNLAAGLQRDQFIDFSLMVRRVVDALAAGEAAAGRVIAPIRHLMVDEYQDVNPAQEALIRNLNRHLDTLFVVGDDDQAIYAWRGADVSNIITFQSRYPTCAIHTLSRNFRSTPPIVRVSDGFIAAELGSSRITKNPQAARDDRPRELGVLWFDTRADEADWVAARIARLLNTAYSEPSGTTRGLTPGDFTVLMRSTRSNEGDGSPRHAAFTRALQANGIPYTLAAGGGVFARPEVAALRESFELLRNGNPSREVVHRLFDSDIRPAFPSADFDRVVTVVSGWGRRIHAPAGGPRQRIYPQRLVYDLLEAFGIITAPPDPGVMRDIGVFSRIIQDVETVYLSVDSPDRFHEILNFLRNAAEKGYDTSTEDLLLRPDAVTVSTVHQVKGLEFPVVFVVDVEQNRFPGTTRRYSGWLPQAVIAPALNRGAYQSNPAEEARLFYTALTRAERYLHVTGCAALPGGVQQRKRSTFSLRLSDPEVSNNPAAIPAGLVAHSPVRRIEDVAMPTSFSDIRYYLRCPKDYQFRKSFGFSPAVPDLFGYGRTVHAAVGKLHEVFPSSAPTSEEAEAVARDVFHLKHVPESRDPVNHPGPYERGRDAAARTVRVYAQDYSADFTHERQVEQPFEVPVRGAVITGSIDLLLRFDDTGRVVSAQVVDFKTMEGGELAEENEALHWTELALQVQLYALAAREILGENARTGAVHLLRDGQRISVPVDFQAVRDAVENVEWAVQRIMEGEFPMRPHPTKCEACDFKQICSKQPQGFQTDNTPPPIHVPGQRSNQMARAFSEFGSTS